jgi:asparagine synthase (glutamine-hydrolysing)
MFDVGGGQQVEQAILERMTTAIKHRGPDDFAYFVNHEIGFGFRRLSIIDPAGGRQPMWNETRSVVSICNGEIFNYKELREWLENRGHRFTSKCDVEVLSHLYEECGTEMVEKLDGQFAFAIYDQNRHLLFCARDHFGIVPFFYADCGGVFLFASEIKALLPHPKIKREVNLTGLDQILCFPGLVSPETMFAGIKSLASGHCITVSAKGIEIREYWDLNYPIESGETMRMEEHEYIEGVHDYLRRSVKKRLMSDVPLGVYLSGGLDSSIISALVCKEEPTATRHSFGISFNGNEMCEKKYQQSVASYVGTTHHDLPFSPENVAEGLPRALYYSECPIKESYDTTCLGLSQIVKSCGVSVVLTGQGADELFGGYIGYRFDQFFSDKPRLDPNEGKERKIREQLWGDPVFAYDRDYSALQRLKSVFYSQIVRQELPKFDCLLSLPLRKDRLEGRHILHKRSYLDFKLRLADHLLADHGDRMAMANSVEVRHPFLDIDLVKFVSAIPPSIKLKNLTEKYILRQIGAAIVPPEIARREKFGWFAYGSPELMRLEKQYIQDLLSLERIKRQGYFDAKKVKELIARYTAPGFSLNQPFETDLLLLVLSCTAFVEIFDMPYLN